MEIIVKNYTLTIDDEDFDLINKMKWNVRRQYDRQFYFTSNRIWLHRLIVNCPKDVVVDHINGDTLDNRKSNLRICTKLQNQYNQKKHKGKRHSRYKGVTFRKNLKSKPWEAFVYKDGKSKRLGYFATEKEAALAYNNAAKDAYGEFARLNEVG
jgi:hypothetical protein